jgi:hypothetical protein
VKFEHVSSSAGGKVRSLRPLVRNGDDACNALQIGAERTPKGCRKSLARGVHISLKYTQCAVKVVKNYFVCTCVSAEPLRQVLIWFH